MISQDVQTPTDFFRGFVFAAASLLTNNLNGDLMHGFVQKTATSGLRQ